MIEPDTTELIAVDVGNTMVHLGRFLVSDCGSESVPQPIDCLQIRPDDLSVDALGRWASSEPLKCFIASVSQPMEERFIACLQAVAADTASHLMRRDNLPIQVAVDAPHRVGMDRLAAAVAANRLRPPERSAIVVDAGTAITIDAISADGVFRGGAILPGMGLAAAALAEKTDALPCVPAIVTAPPVIGKSTEAAIQSGLFWGSCGAIRELVGRISAELGNQPLVIVTGGDALRLAKTIELEVVVVEHLVLSGIALAATS
jgi:type III pantothenate kinase